MTKVEILNAFLDILEGETCSLEEMDEMREFCEKQIASIERSAEKAKARPKKERTGDTEFGTAIKNAIIKFVGTTPKTSIQLAEEMENAGVLSPNGSPFLYMHIAQYAAKMPEIESTSVVVEKVDKNGLKSQKLAKGFKLKF